MSEVNGPDGRKPAGVAAGSSDAPPAPVVEEGAGAAPPAAAPMDEYVQVGEAPGGAAAAVPGAPLPAGGIHRLIEALAESPGGSRYRPAFSVPGVTAFLAEYVAERYRPTTAEVAQRWIDSVAHLYVTGIVVTLHRLGFEKDDPFAHAILQAALRSDTAGIIDRPPPTGSGATVDDRRMTTLLEAAYGWRADTKSYEAVQTTLEYLPRRLSPQLAGHILFDANNSDLDAAVAHARRITKIYGDLSSWLMGHAPSEAQRQDAVTTRIRNVFAGRALARAMHGGRLSVLTREEAQTLAFEEIDRSIEEGARGTGYVTEKSTVTEEQVYRRLLQMKEGMLREFQEALARRGSGQGASASGFAGLVVADEAASPPADGAAVDEPDPADAVVGGAAALTGEGPSLLPVPVALPSGGTPVR